jgi:enediyne biosynthesis protein E4
MMGGVAAFDYNNDGWLDLFFSNGAAIPSLEKTEPKYYNRLYRNNGDGTFSDVTVKAGLQGTGYCMGVAAGDYDNDGSVDLYVCGVNHNQLLHNNGDGTFTDVTAKAGVSGIHPKFGKTWAVTAGWFDYNNDGLLDLFVCNYLKYDLATAPPCVLQGYAAYCSPNEFPGLPNMLYRNNGDGTFTEVTEESGLHKHLGKGMGIAFADYDSDGFMDVFVSNDSFRNFLFHNNGNGTFSEVARDLGVAYNENGGTVAGMGADFRDLNEDGRPDIFHTAMFADTFVLYRNTGHGFEDATVSSRLAAQTRTLTGWGTGAYDFDNDGRKDLFTANSEILDNSMEIGHRPFPLSNSIFRNTGNLQFADVSSQAGPSFLKPLAHRGAAFGDFDNDGRVDIAVTVLNGPPQILMNRSKNKNHWLIIRLIGTRDNRDGLGARIQVTTSNGVQYNHASTAVGYNSSSDKRVHFGLGDTAMADRIEVHWPTGHRQILSNVRGDQILTITQDEDSSAPKYKRR